MTFHGGATVALEKNRPLTINEERGEVLAGVLESLHRGIPDRDCAAACSELLAHLSQTADRPPRP